MSAETRLGWSTAPEPSLQINFNPLRSSGTDSAVDASVVHILALHNPSKPTLSENFELLEIET